MTGIYVILAILIVIVIAEFALIKSINNKLRRQKQRYDHLLRGNIDMNLEELLLSINDRIEGNRGQGHDHGSNK